MEAARTWLMRLCCCASDDGVAVTSVATSASMAIRREVPLAPPSASTLLPRGGLTGLGNALPGLQGGWTTADAVPGRAEGLPGAPGGELGLSPSPGPPSPAPTSGLRSCMAASRMRSP